MIFRTADAASNAAAAVAALRAEVGPDTPVATQTFTAVPTVMRGLPMMAQIIASSWNNEPAFLHAIVMELSQPGPWGVGLLCTRVRGYVVATRLTLAAMLRGTITQPTRRQQVGGLFAGDPALSARLNHDGEFVSAVGSHCRTRIQVGGKMIGGWHLDVHAYALLQQTAGGVAFVLGTIPAMNPLTLSAAIHAPAFVSLAGRVQGHLDALAPR